MFAFALVLLTMIIWESSHESMIHIQSFDRPLIDIYLYINHLYLNENQLISLRSKWSFWVDDRIAMYSGDPLGCLIIAIQPRRFHSIYILFVACCPMLSNVTIAVHIHHAKGNAEGLYYTSDHWTNCTNRPQVDHSIQLGTSKTASWLQGQHLDSKVNILTPRSTSCSTWDSQNSILTSKVNGWDCTGPNFGRIWD
jgi:disulfide bond formation protein DsbB